MNLYDKFTKDEIEWRVQQSGITAKGPWAMVLPYITSRAIMDRLDNVVGPMNWKVQHLHMPGGMACIISIYDHEKKEWISKEDGAPETKVESFKGAMSDSLKRAAVLWGMGRYLYAMKGPYYVVLKPDKTGEYNAVIEDKQTKAKTYYTWDAPAVKDMYAEPSQSSQN